MAKKNLVKVKALVNIKYDKKCVSINEEISVRAEDAKEMKERGFVEILGEVPEENKDGEGDPPEEGEE